jgi:hypothetical protein
MVFSTQLCELLLLWPSLWFNSPPSPLPRVNKNTAYTYTVCKGGGGYEVLDLRQINTCRKVPLQVNFFRWRPFAPPSMSLIFLPSAEYLFSYIALLYELILRILSQSFFVTIRRENYSSTGGSGHPIPSNRKVNMKNLPGRRGGHLKFFVQLSNFLSAFFKRVIFLVSCFTMFKTDSSAARHIPHCFGGYAGDLPMWWRLRHW